MDDILKILDDVAIRPYVVSTRDGFGLYPSSASVKFTKDNVEQVVGACLRQLWYKFKNYPIVGEDTIESIDKRNIGDWFEKNLIERAKAVGLYVADQVPFKDPETGVSGRIDLIIKDPYTAPKPPNRPEPSQLIGIEMKSTGGYHLIKGPIISTKDVPLMPKLEHVLQVMLYLGYYSKFGLDRWVLIYQDRESMRKQWHKIMLNENGSPIITNIQQSVTINEITLQGIKDRFIELNKHLVNNTIPDRDYELQYSAAKIIKLLNADELSETDSNKVRSKIKKHSVDGRIPENIVLLEKGDTECIFCPFKELCWSENPIELVSQAKMPMKIVTKEDTFKKVEEILL